MMLGLGLATLVALPVRAPAQSAPDAKAAAEAPPPATEAERQERDGRRLCAVALCGTLHAGKPAVGLGGCNLQRTWRKAELDNLLAHAKVSWPWGDARCVTHIEIDRSLLAKILQEPDLDVQLDAHTVRCQIESGRNRYQIALQVRPRVRFRQGKATEVTLTWGRIDGSPRARSALWSLAAADNIFGFLRSAVLDDINGFIGPRCMEAKAEWQGR
jgi:hypothetical protein